MKTTFYILLFVLTQNICFSQVDYSDHWANSGWQYGNESDSLVDVSTKVINDNDLTHLLKFPYSRYGTNREVIPSYGLLGNDFRKTEILFTQVKQNKKDVSRYDIIGKIKLGDTINDLKGNITFNKATANISNDNSIYTIIELVGSYKFKETNRKTKNATLKGSVKLILFTDTDLTTINWFDTSVWYEDGAIKGFVGTRKSKGITKSLLWGFPRFSNYSKDFDVGAGEAIINIKYAKTWFNYSEKQWDSIHKENQERLYTIDVKEFVEPYDADWYKDDKLNELELEKKALKQLSLKPEQVAREFISTKEFNKILNETIVVIPEIKNDSSEQGEYELTAHILVVNSITGKIKYHFKEHGLHSNAIAIDDIVITPENYYLTKTENAFGITVHYSSNSQPNPYSSKSLSLYIKEHNELKKVLDNLEIYERTGVVNVSGDCYAEFEQIDRTIWVKKGYYSDEDGFNENYTNGYYDILINQTDTKTIYKIDATGECNEKTLRNETSYKNLQFDNTYYQEVSNY